jgi:hypothetical protein
MIEQTKTGEMTAQEEDENFGNLNDDDHEFDEANQKDQEIIERLMASNIQELIGGKSEQLDPEIEDQINKICIGLSRSQATVESYKR